MTDRVLPAVVVLRSDQDREHPVWDLERLCRVVLDGHLRATATPLEPADYDEALGFLLAESYVIFDGYDRVRASARTREHGRSLGFPGWLQWTLGMRLRDHLRAPYGKRAEPRIGQGRFVEFDRPGAGGDGHPLVEALAESAGDRDDDRGEALGGLDAPRDRDVLREVAGLGLRKGRGVAPRDRGGDRDLAAEVAAGPWRDCAACGWRNYPQAPNGLPGWHLEECACCGVPLEGGVAA